METNVSLHHNDEGTWRRPVVKCRLEENTTNPKKNE